MPFSPDERAARVAAAADWLANSIIPINPDAFADLAQRFELSPTATAEACRIATERRNETRTTEDDPISEAVAWLVALPWPQRPRPLVPHLRRMFDLSALQACQALAEANRKL